MNVESIRLFLRITETGSISSAARSMSLSPSLATRKIAALEVEIGSRLFNRTTRKVEMTEAGELLKTWAGGSLDGLGSVLDEIAALQQRPRGLVRLACTDFIAMTYLPELLIRFEKAYPEITVSILTVERAVRLAEENFDVAIHSGTEPEGFVIGRKMWDIQPILAASPGYVARHGAPDRPSQLSSHRCIAHAIFESTTWDFVRRGRMHTFDVVPHIRTTNALFQAELARRGLGITNISRRTAAEHLKSGALVEVMSDYRCVLPNGKLMATWIIFPHRNMLNRTRIFVDALMAHFQKFA